MNKLMSSLVNYNNNNKRKMNKKELLLLKFLNQLNKIKLRQERELEYNNQV